MRVLVVEDDARIASDVSRALNLPATWWKSRQAAKTRGSAATPRTTEPSSSTSVCRTWTDLRC